jgi:hypothetical protein
VKLYSTLGFSSITGEDGEPLAVELSDSSVTVSEDYGRLLHGRFVGGVRAWEDEPERHARLVAEADAHRRDPATLLAAVEALQAAALAVPAPVAAPVSKRGVKA